MEIIAFETVPIDITQCNQGLVLTGVDPTTGEIITSITSGRSGAITVDASLTPTFTNVSPKREVVLINQKY